MYVLVQHTISDPASFWCGAGPSLLTFHHTVAADDGTHAVWLREAASVGAVRDAA